MSRKSKQIKKGIPSWTADGVVMGWYVGDNQRVPAIEQCRVAVVKCPILYYQHFYYSPEAMELRNERVKELGWNSLSFDLPMPPAVIGEYSLLSDALNKVKGTLDFPKIVIRRNWPSTITLEKEGYEAKWDYCELFFSRYAYEFYHLLFILGTTTSASFENVPNPKLNTFNQLMLWAKSFESKRRNMYRKEGLTWEPYSSKNQPQKADEP